MSKSSSSSTSRKAPAGSETGSKPIKRPKKPYADFPLSPHASGKWQKKIMGRIHYFGTWAKRVDGKLQRVADDGWKDALDLYKKQADDLHAGRTPRTNTDGLTVAVLCNHFLTSRLRKREAGELTARMFAEYKLMTDLAVAAFGSNRLVDDLAADDFAALRASMAKTWGPLRLLNGVTRIKSIFKFGFESGLMDRPPRYGPEFKPPSQSVLRRHRAKSPPKMFDPGELRKLLDAAGVQLRAMILLGLNCGFDNGDCGSLPFAAIDLKSGWINFPRPKTGIARRCPLWPESVAAIHDAIAVRPKPATDEDAELAFLTYRGTAWVRIGAKSRTDYVSIHFNALLKKVKANRSRAGFYTLRHVFRTIADSARDTVAANLIMGHGDPSMGATYRERIEDARLVAIAEHVRAWLFGGEGGAP